jgi:hypothetical protein
MGEKYRQEIIATIFAFFRTGGMYILTNIVIFLWIVFGFWMSPGGKTAVWRRVAADNASRTRVRNEHPPGSSTGTAQQIVV